MCMYSTMCVHFFKCCCQSAVEHSIRSMRDVRGYFKYEDNSYQAAFLVKHYIRIVHKTKLYKLKIFLHFCSNCIFCCFVIKLRIRRRYQNSQQLQKVLHSPNQARLGQSKRLRFQILLACGRTLMRTIGAVYRMPKSRFARTPVNTR